jgi:hypothetical protein
METFWSKFTHSSVKLDRFRITEKYFTFMKRSSKQKRMTKCASKTFVGSAVGVIALSHYLCKQHHFIVSRKNVDITKMVKPTKRVSIFSKTWFISSKTFGLHFLTLLVS